MRTGISKLIQLGLSEYEAMAYVALLKENPSSAYEIAKNSGIPTSKIYEVIRRLEYKKMVQSIHGERSRMFIPVSPNEFIQSFRLETEEKLQAVETELKGVRTGIDTSYTWHIKDYESLVHRAKRMVDTARKTILLQIWPKEADGLFKTLHAAENRGLKIAVIHYGATNIKINQLYRHPVEDTIFAQRDARGFILVADSKEAVIGRINEKKTEAIWSMNESFVMMAEDYIRHDIYFMKLVERFNPLLREKFGNRHEKLRDVYTDEEV